MSVKFVFLLSYFILVSNQTLLKMKLNNQTIPYITSQHHLKHIRKLNDGEDASNQE